MKRIAFRVVPAVGAARRGLAWVGPARVRTGSRPMPSTKNGEWPMYTADLRGSKYSPLDQINATNFSKMEVAWRFKTDNLGPRPETQARRHADHGQGHACTRPRAPAARSSR